MTTEEVYFEERVEVDKEGRVYPCWPQGDDGELVKNKNKLFTDELSQAELLPMLDKLVPLCFSVVR